MRRSSKEHFITLTYRGPARQVAQ